MFAKFKKLNHLFLFLLIFLNLLPVILSIYWLHNSVSYNLGILIVSVCVIALIFLFYQKLPILCILILGFFALLGLIELIFIFNYGYVINSNALFLLKETNPSELMDQIFAVPLYYYVFLAFIIFIIIFNVVLHTPINYINRKKLFIYSSATLFIALFAAYHTSSNTTTGEGEINRFSFNNYSGEMVLRGSYPLGLFFAVSDYFTQRQELITVAEEKKFFRFMAQRVRDSDEQQVYVLVIGETGRFYNWSINGYERNTSPMLSARNDVLSIKEMYTESPFTRYSVPVMITRKLSPGFDANFRETSIVSFFKEIGFKTFWISMQAPFGFDDSPISMYAFEADEIKFLNPVDYRFNGKPDYESLPEVERFISENKNDDIFIVIHTLGSHARYVDRYDEQFRVFVPDRPESGVESIYNPADKEYIINGYDNTILVTDYLLGNLINLLEAQNIPSWMFYVADHGESLFDYCLPTGGHGHYVPTPATHHVAAFFWASNEYKQHNMDLISHIETNAVKPTSTNMMFDTLATLGGGMIPGERVGYNLASDSIVLPTIRSSTISTCAQE